MNIIIKLDLDYGSTDLKTKKKSRIYITIPGAGYTTGSKCRAEDP
jgi:hypothetical protein